MKKELRTTIDEPTMKKMAKFQLFRLRRRSFIITTTALIIGMITSVYAITIEENKTTYIVLLVILPLLYFFLFYISPMITSKSILKRLKLKEDEKVTYKYTFNDNDFDVELFFGETLRANNTVSYKSINKLYEWQDFIYIVMKERFAFIINKKENSEEAINNVKEFITTKMEIPYINK